MDYIYSVLNTMGLIKIEDEPVFAKPDGYKNINSGQTIKKCGNRS